MYDLQDDLDRGTALADEIDAGRKGDRRLTAQERQVALQGPADVVYGNFLGMVGAKVQTSVGGQVRKLLSAGVSASSVPVAIPSRRRLFSRAWVAALATT